MFIQDWFLRELRLIDPNYSVEVDQQAGLYEIKNSLSIKIPRVGGGYAHVHGQRTVDVFKELNDAALDTLRFRKRLGERIKILEDPVNELKYWASLEKEARAKKEKEKDDRYGECAKQMVKAATSKTFHMPGVEIKK